MLYFGIVEDVQDPLEAGRIKVRVFGVHTANKTVLPTEGLPWAQCMAGSYQGTFSGVGNSPTGIMNGEMMVVSFLDKMKQTPLVMGSLAGFNTEAAMNLMGSVISRDSTEYGFAQELLAEAYLNQVDTNFQARTDMVHPVHDQRVAEKKTSVTKSDGNTWDEPESTMTNSEYPHSKVVETQGGHLLEIDDTTGNERLLDWHTSGTFKEVSNGHTITKIIGDNFELTIGNKNVYIEADENVTVDGNNTVYVVGNITELNDGNKTVTIGGHYDETVTGNITESNDGNKDVTTKGSHVEDIGSTADYISGGHKTLKAPTIDVGTEGIEPAVLGDKLATWITSELVPWANSHFHIGNLGVPTSVPVVAFQAGTGALGGVVYSTTVKIQK